MAGLVRRSARRGRVGLGSGIHELFADVGGADGLAIPARDGEATTAGLAR